MTFPKQLFPLFFLLFFLFPLRQASKPNKCSSSISRPLRCGPLEVPIRFPFCDHARFNLLCTNLNNTVLELPMSGIFFVQYIDYRKQEIYINDPENCLAKRLLTFNISGSPFSPRFDILYTFLTCPNEVVLPSWYPSISCLSNSTSSFFATPNFTLAQSMLPSCQIVKRLHVPVNPPFRERFSSFLNNQSLLLKWDSPDCRDCEINYLRCGFKNKASLEVKCFGVKESGTKPRTKSGTKPGTKSGHISSGVVAVLIIVSIIGGAPLFATCICMWNSRRLNFPSGQHSAVAAATVMQQPIEAMARRGLDQSTIETYKTIELGESRRLSGTNGIVCPICLSEYASKETVRFIPKCDHCFHVECIDVWLKIHGSCPLCRNSSA